MINLNHLRAFYVCALHKNVTKAANVLGISQPSLSQQIKLFEEEIKAPLFYRNGRTLSLTTKGSDLFLQTEDHMCRLMAVGKKINSDVWSQKEIKIAVSDQVERPFVAKIISQITNDSLFKNCRFTIHSDRSDILLKKYNLNHFQIFLSHQELKKITPFEVFELPVKLITKKPYHEYSNINQEKFLSLFKAMEQKLLLPTRDIKLRSETEIFFSKHKFKGQIILESNILACLSEGIRNGMGCGLLPIAYTIDDIKQNQLSIFGPKNGFWIHKIYLYCKQQSELTTKFIRILKNNSYIKGIN